MTLFESGVRPVIDAYLLEESKKVRSYGDYWSASSAGYCMRKVIFDRLGLPPVSEDPRKQRVFTSGHIFHEWIQKLTKDAGISIAQEVELQDEELMIRGHFDDLVLITTKVKDLVNKDGVNGTRVQDHLILYDYKTRNSKNFHYAKQPSYFHRLQLGTYMYMLRKLSDSVEGMGGKLLPLGKQLEDLKEARTLNISKDDLRMAEVQYLWDTEMEKDVVGYWATLNGHWAARKLPPCTCHEQAGGFMAKEKWNPYWFEGEPCSVAWLTKHPEVKEKWA